MIVAIIASTGVILSAAYMLWLYRRVIFGRLANSETKAMKDLNKTELYIFLSLAILTLLFGFYPEPLMNSIEVSVENVLDMYNTNINSNIVYKK